MATVDEILARQAYAAGDDIWTEDSRYPSYRLYVEPEYVPVTNKRIADFNDQVSVTGEQNAQFVGFRLPRYDDGIDLRTQNLYIHYQTAFGGGDSVPCNVSWSDNYVRMCWMVPAQATQEPDRVQMMIYATGTNSMGERVTWKTLPASYTIHDGLDIGGGIPEPDTSWYEQFVQQMEGRVSTAQGYADDAQASRTEAAGSATAAAQSAAASAQALKDNKVYVESQKETFVGYNKRETDLKYANALVGSASGMGRVSIGDAWEAPVAGMDISGRSEQVVTTGAQLFDVSNVVTLKNSTVNIGAYGRFITVSGANAYSAAERIIPIELVANKTITLTGKILSQSNPSGKATIQVALTLADNTIQYNNIASSQGKVTVKVPADIRIVNIRLISNNNSGNLDTTNTVIFADVMLNIGDTSLPWEPYTGGKPSPSPEYPQPIKGTGTVSTGAQMLNLGEVEKQKTIGGITYTIDSQNGTITANGTATETSFLSMPISIPKGEKIYIGAGNTSVVPSGNIQVLLRLSGDNGVEASSNTYLSNQHATNIFTTTQHCNFVHFRFGAGEVVNNFVIKPMIAFSDKPLPWEPYTGGKPSPSPEYPQPLDVTVTGANLFDESLLQSKTIWGITFTNNGDGSFTAEGKATNYANIRADILLPPGTYIASGTQGETKFFVRIFTSEEDYLDYNNTPFTISGNEYSVQTYIQVTNGRTASETIWPMVNIGHTALSWGPYAGYQTATIALTEPLHGTGDVRDRIMYKDGIWGIERNRKIAIYDGVINRATVANESWDTQYPGFVHCNLTRMADWLVGQVDFMSDAFPCTTEINRNFRNTELSCHTSNDGIYLFISHELVGITDDDDSATRIAKVNAWIQSHNFKVEYSTTTPTWEPLPSDTQSALNALTTYTGTTHVTITAGGPEPDVGLEYVMDTRAVITDLQAQIDEIRGGTT